VLASSGKLCSGGDYEIQLMQEGDELFRSGGILVALAIALHNIPEGIRICVPIYSATGKRGKASPQWE